MMGKQRGISLANSELPGRSLALGSEAQTEVSVLLGAARCQFARFTLMNGEEKANYVAAPIKERT